MFFGLFLFLALLPPKAPTPLLPEVVINEIAWMGGVNSYNDEWLELYNNSPATTSLEGWKLLAEDGKPEIVLKKEIPPKGFFLLERTDDQSAPGIGADLIYRGSLNNQGENLKLIDKRGNLIDQADFSSGWLWGSNKTKQTMERKFETWQTSEKPGGTPKAENSPGKIEDDLPETEKVTGGSPLETGEVAAKIEQALPGTSNPLVVLLIAFLVAVVSGAAVLIIKNKLK